MRPNREKTVAELRSELQVMSRGDAKHWHQPRTLFTLAAQPYTLWLQDRIWSRPGDIPGRGPVHVIGRAADHTNGAITERLTPVLGYLGTQGFLPRSWTVAYSWLTNGQAESHGQTRPGIRSVAVDASILTAYRVMQKKSQLASEDQGSRTTA